MLRNTCCRAEGNRKTGLAVSLFCLAFSARTLCAQQGSIQGTTLNALTHEPISGVHVTLLATTHDSVTATYGAISDRDGHFSIATIRPGTYMIQVERNGFLFGATKATVPVTRVAIRSGQQVTGFTVELTPRAILSGRVVDDLGDPVQDVTVVRIPVDEDPDYFSMHMAGMPTDDRGEFRMVVPPGRYYLQTSNAGSRPNNEISEQRDGVAVAPLRPTFYPSAIVRDRATPVEAVAGKETGGLEIRMSRQAGIRVSGVIRGMPDPFVRPRVIVQWGSRPQVMRVISNMTTGADGRFTIRDAQAGLYRLYGYWPGKQPMATPTIEVRVAGADVTDLELALAPAPEITGVVEVEGDPPGVDRPKRTVRLEGINRESGMPSYDEAADSKGAFTLSGVAPSRYRVRVTPLPEDAYVKKVLVGDTESADDTLDMSAAARKTRIKVIVARDGAQITGRVLDENGDENPLGYVLLSPAPVASETATVTSASTEPDGTYRFTSLRPGKYRILAIDPFRNANIRMAERSRTVLEKGVEIELAPRSKLQQDLRPVPTPTNR